MKPLFILLAGLTSSLAMAASVSGTVQFNGGGLSGQDVRLWRQGTKGYAIAYTTSTGADGTYQFGTVSAGSYKLDTRMSNGVGGNYGDRWYLAGGYPAGAGYDQAQASVITVGSANVTGLNISVEVLGGVDGNAVNGSGVALGGIQTRCELKSNRVVHHNDSTDATSTEHPGMFSYRGLVPGANRLILHDPNYTLADVVVGTINISSGTVVSQGDVTMSSAVSTASDGNNNATDSNSGIDLAPLRVVPPATPGTFSANAVIGPRTLAETDWYCFDGEASDRLLIRARGLLTLEDGTVVDSPWVDPQLQLRRISSLGGTATLGPIGANDDAPGLGLGSLLDVGSLNDNGRYCVVVSTFGDTAFNGGGQQSAGRYSLNISMGNRRPTITISNPNGTAVTNPLEIYEQDAVAYLFNYADPDQNLTSGSVQVRDAQGNVVATGTLNPATNSFLFTWTSPATGATEGPYVVTGTVSDGEFTSTATVTIVVLGFNNGPPGMPTLRSPDSGVTVSTRTPTLKALESFDIDRETLSYEFELTLAGDAGVQLGTVTGVTNGWSPDAGPAPEVSYVPSALPENSWVTWRVRAKDGVTQSAWTGAWRFFVDALNDPPDAPVLTKPADGEEVPTQLPALAATNPVDPEGDAIELVFEVATDVAFTNLVETSAPQPLAVGSTTTQYSLTQALDWGGAYFARVKAIDARGGSSAYSNTNQFRVRDNGLPATPTLGAPFASCGGGLSVGEAPATITIPPVNDMEMDALTVEAQLFLASDDPATATPLWSESVTQTPGQPAVLTLSGVAWVEDQQYRVRVRVSDPFNTTAWVECLFTLNAVMEVPDSGAGGGGGGGGGGNNDAGVTSDAGVGGGTGGGPNITAKPGCGCTSIDASLSLVGVALLMFRRRRTG